MSTILDIKPIFMYKREYRGQFNDTITFMIPITSKDLSNIRSAVSSDKYSVILENKLEIRVEDLLMYGTTDDVYEDVAKKLGVESIWYPSIKDLKNREFYTDKQGTLLLCQYFDPVLLVNLGVAMLGKPDLALVAKIRYDKYIDSEFFNNKIKPVTHGLK